MFLKEVVSDDALLANLIVVLEDQTIGGVSQFGGFVVEGGFAGTESSIYSCGNGVGPVGIVGTASSLGCGDVIQVESLVAF